MPALENMQRKAQMIVVGIWIKKELKQDSSILKENKTFIWAFCLRPVNLIL